MLVEEVLSHGTVGFGRSDTGQAADEVAQLLDGVVAVGEEVLLEEITQLREKNGETELFELSSSEYCRHS